MGARKVKRKDPNASLPPDEDIDYVSERLARLESGETLAPSPSLPLPDGYRDENRYIDDLLLFATSNRLLQLLTGGVHILDFLTRDPDFYESLLPETWRAWFASRPLEEILDFILRDDLQPLADSVSLDSSNNVPPPDLVDFIWDIRRLLLKRDYVDPDEGKGLERHVAVGMKVKKLEEVAPFSRFIRRLAKDVESAQKKPITHLVDFGAGQNYLGRTLASYPTNRNVIAVESRAENVKGARRMDISAKLAPREGILRNKKLWKQWTQGERPPDLQLDAFAEVIVPEHLRTRTILDQSTGKLVPAIITPSPQGTGAVQHIEQKLDSGDLSHVVENVVDNSALAQAEEIPAAGENGRNTDSILAVESLKKEELNLMVISLHSCGNLSHFGLRSLVMNPEVSAAVIVGCCYNLATERLSKPSYKHPSLRPACCADVPKDRLLATAGDPQGFPMSQRLCEYPVRPGKKGVHLNITTRMMAVQAPANWSPEDCENFFTRHFYRSLLQRVFLDYGIIEKPDPDEEYLGYVAGDSLVGYSAASGGGPPGSAIVVGSLRKPAYSSFTAYARAALSKLEKDPKRAESLCAKLGDIADETLAEYEAKFMPKKKELSIVWALMAYSACLAEAIIVVDRWQWLKEQPEVGECWVEPVFDYGKSPRNLAVIGIKK